MLPARAVREMLITALYFAVFGMFWFLLLYAVQIILASFVMSVTNMDEVTTFVLDGEPVGWRDYIHAMLRITLFLIHFPLIIGFSSSTSLLWAAYVICPLALFFSAGLVHGARPRPHKRREIFRRSCKAALGTAFLCGWCSALTGVILFWGIGGFRDIVVSIGLTGFFVGGLFIGTVLGCSIGALSPRIAERARSGCRRLLSFRHA